MSLDLEEVTGPVIGAAIEVHRSLGPGFIEAVYEEALAIELRERAIPFERQVAVSVSYRGHVVGLHRLDIFVGGQIVVELKAVKDLTDTHFAVVRSYLRVVDCSHGLILNFAKTALEVRRVRSRPET
jgi:GxxExxY protein